MRIPTLIARFRGICAIRFARMEHVRTVPTWGAKKFQKFRWSGHFETKVPFGRRSILKWVFTFAGLNIWALDFWWPNLAIQKLSSWHFGWQMRLSGWIWWLMFDLDVWCFLFLICISDHLCFEHLQTLRRVLCCELQATSAEHLLSALQKEWKKTWSTEGFQDTRKQSQPLKQMVNMSLNVTYI